LMDRSASVIPMLLRPSETRSLFDSTECGAGIRLPDGRVANLGTGSRPYLESMGSLLNAPNLFYHALASLHAPDYRTENAGALRHDWPRIPLPAGRDALLASAALGRRLAALLDPEQAVSGVTAGTIRPELRAMGQTCRADGRSLNASEDLTITAGWGHAGQGGVTMPGQGKLKPRAYTADEMAALEAGAAALGIPVYAILQLLGESTVDVYLNEVACWQNIPARVWSYTIGGYQVIKKWLSYREAALLGRALRKEEARHVTDMVRRIACILLMEPELDENYRSVKANAYDWPGM